MRFSTSFTPKLLAALGAAVSLALPSLVSAEAYPSYAVAPQQTIKGTITGFNGAYTVFVQDERGYGDNVQMHDGTVINPTGIKLQEGMRVTIYGYANGPVFQAYRIDTPYQQPYYANNGYGGYGYGGYGYGGYGYGYPYGGYPYYGGYYGAPYPYWGVGIGWWGGWPGWGWGWGSPIFYRGPGFFRRPVIIRERFVRPPVRGGTLRAPGSGTLRAPANGSVRAPVSSGTVRGTMHGAGHPPIHH
jgi:hypothetical protein